MKFRDVSKAEAEKLRLSTELEREQHRQYIEDIVRKEKVRVVSKEI